jgi:hypothetical protein
VTPTVHPIAAALRTALDAIADYQPRDLADTHHLLHSLAGDGTGDYNTASHLAHLIARLGSPRLNPTLHQLPAGPATDLIRTATDYYETVIVDGLGSDAIGEALTAIEQPWAARDGDAFLTAHGVDTDTDLTPAAAIPARARMTTRPRTTTRPAGGRP